MDESINNLEEQLENQRKEFAQAGNSKKQTLKSSIITNEQNLETMYQTYKKILVETRNSEIRYLRTKN
jgi:predicted YcjX-like family ATPase